MNTNIDLNSYVKFAADGTVDQTSTVAQFTSDLEAFVAETAEERSNIASAVNATFDGNKGQALTMPVLTSIAVTKHLNAQPNNMEALKVKVANYVRSNTAEFGITRGKNGGVRRLADHSAKSE